MATPAMSSGRPMRSRGAAAAIWSPNASRVAAIILDSKGPGATALTVMVGARRLARWAPQWAPALLTSTSTRPWWAETASANWRAPSSEDRSAAKPEHAPKSDSSATAACTAWALRDATITVAPAATKPAAIMCPMPRVPPVTTTVFPATEKRSAGEVDKAGSLMASDGSARGRPLLGSPDGRGRWLGLGWPSDGDERAARSQTIFTSGGVTNEFQRDIIAMVGLGMSRPLDNGRWSALHFEHAKQSARSGAGQEDPHERR